MGQNGSMKPLAVAGAAVVLAGAALLLKPKNPTPAPPTPPATSTPSAPALTDSLTPTITVTFS